MSEANGIISIGVVVKDIVESLEFYTRIIGMKEAKEFSIDADFGKKSGLTNAEPFDVKVLQLAEGPLSTKWKLIAIDNKPEIVMNQYIRDRIGMQYITINYNDLGPVLKRLKDGGVKLLSEKPVPMGNGKYFALTRDPNGIFIELIGPLE